MYKAIQKFRDGENGKPFAENKGGVVYEVGDNYPITGFEPTDKHIEYLLGCNFRGKGAVIEKVGDDDKPLSQMTVDGLKKFADENGIDISEANNKKEMVKLIEEASQE